MTTSTLARIILYLIAAILLCTAIILLPSCEFARQVDEIIWREPHTTPDPHDPTVTIQPAPPIVEIIASCLAALGFGGMTAWIRSNNKRTKGDAKVLNESVNDLNARLLSLEAADPNPPTAELQLHLTNIDNRTAALVHRVDSLEHDRRT